MRRDIKVEYQYIVFQFLRIAMYFSSTEFGKHWQCIYVYIQLRDPRFFSAPPNAQFLLSEYCGQIQIQKWTFPVSL